MQLLFVKRRNSHDPTHSLIPDKDPIEASTWVPGRVAACRAWCPLGWRFPCLSSGLPPTCPAHALQGSQLLRAVVQRCQHLLPGKMHTLVTLGGQHQGVMDVPGCSAPGNNESLACRAMQTMLVSAGAWRLLPACRARPCVRVAGA